MRIIEPAFKLSTPYAPFLVRPDGIQMLRFIELQGRISHRSEDKMLPDSWERFIKAVVLEHGDWSIVEHASLTCTIRMDRGICLEMVRHRLFSYTMESTRFVRYRDELEFIRPTELKPSDSAVWELAMKQSEQSYSALLALGNRPQEARSVLPNALAATIAVTGNLRSFRHLFLMRTSRETHADFRRLTVPMLEEFKKVVPLIFDDIEPNARQIDNLRKAR